MSLPPIPRRLAAALELLGEEWSEVMIKEAFVWVFSGSQLRYMVGVAADTFGSAVAALRSNDQRRLDAEDACQDFASRRFEKVVRRYDPTRGQFEVFLMVCFRRYCRASRRVLLRRAQRERLLDEAGWADTPSGLASPEAVLLRQEARRSTRRMVAGALEELQEADRELLILEYWHDVALDERAAAIGRRPGATRTRATRARQRLAVLLKPHRASLGLGGER